MPGTRLHAVYADKVILARAGLYESLTLKDAVPGLAPGSIISASSTASRSPVVRGDGNRFTVDRQSLTQTMRTPEFLTQALIVPNAGGGFLVREVQPDGLYAKLGVRVGDVVRSINGQPVNTMDDVMKVYQQLGGVGQASAVSIDVTRAGENKSLTYNFE
jgi:S1-C subfamily serine protease